MTTCREVEPLLYLCREGELTQEEEATVADHLASCRNCTSLLKQLTRMETALSAKLAAEVPVREAGKLVEAVLHRLDGRAEPAWHAVREARWSDAMLGWAPSALASVVLALVVLLVVQQSLDSVKIFNLERRLQEAGNAAAVSSEVSAQDLQNLLSLPHRGAAAGVDQIELLQSVARRLTGKDERLFEHLARRFPDLAKITLGDGLDPAERGAMAREGRKFLNEFETLLKQGESNHE